MQPLYLLVALRAALQTCNVNYETRNKNISYMSLTIGSKVDAYYDSENKNTGPRFLRLNLL